MTTTPTTTAAAAATEVAWAAGLTGEELMDATRPAYRAAFRATEAAEAAAAAETGGAGQCTQVFSPGAPEGVGYDPREYPPEVRCSETVGTRLLEFGDDNGYGDDIYQSVKCCAHRGTHNPW